MKQSRIEQIQSAGLRERDEDGTAVTAPADVHLPEVDSAHLNILGLFFSSGQAMSVGMSLYPLTWGEIESFIDVNELSLTLFEKDMLKKMSDAYCGEFSRASDPKRPPPYAPEVEEDEIDHIGNALRMMEQMRLLRKT